jgi:hypothetical protein
MLKLPNRQQPCVDRKTGRTLSPKPPVDAQSSRTGAAARQRPSSPQHHVCVHTQILYTTHTEPSSAHTKTPPDAGQNNSAQAQQRISDTVNHLQGHRMSASKHAHTKNRQKRTPLLHAATALGKLSLHQNPQSHLQFHPNNLNKRFDVHSVPAVPSIATTAETCQQWLSHQHMHWVAPAPHPHRQMSASRTPFPAFPGCDSCPDCTFCALIATAVSTQGKGGCTPHGKLLVRFDPVVNYTALVAKQQTPLIATEATQSMRCHHMTPLQHVARFLNIMATIPHLKPTPACVAVTREPQVNPREPRACVAVRKPQVNPRSTPACIAVLQNTPVHPRYPAQ